MKSVFSQLFALNFFLLFFVILNIPLFAWTTANGVVISNAGGTQWYPMIATDGSNGAIITWYDGRKGSDDDIYTQRVNYSGSTLWTSNGVAICNSGNNQIDPMITSDGSGGAIITWYDYRNDGGSYNNSDIYAQGVDYSGIPQWTSNGVAICTAGYDQSFCTIVSDDTGGAIITWQDDRSQYITSPNDIYAQRINSTGSTLWTANGVAICTAAYDQQHPTIVTDGTGGAIITWWDYRNGSNNNIYAQRINSTGSTLWTLNGVAICTVASSKYYSTIVSDGSGGAIITWFDYRNGSYDIYAQKVNSSGTIQWPVNGVAICTAANIQQFPTIISDGSGGSIITWQDQRSGNLDIYTQRVNSNGAIQWTTNGVVICNAANNQYYPMITSDGLGGAIITWYDFRSSVSDIYAQRVNSSGAIQWTINGVVICNATNEQQHPTIVSDGSGGAIIDWHDLRSGNWNIYAQRIDGSGNTNFVPVELSNFEAMEGIKQ